MIFGKQKSKKGSPASTKSQKNSSVERSQLSSHETEFSNEQKDQDALVANAPFPSEPVTSPVSPIPSSPSEGRPAPISQGITQKDSNTLFLEILMLAMKARETRGLTLADLEWFLLPPVRFNQAVVAETKTNENGKPLPIGFLLWAKVSAEVDARLAQDQSPLPHLDPQDWQSGPIPWVIAAAGRPDIVKAMLERVVKLPLQNQAIKLRIANPDGSFSVKELKVRLEAQEQKPSSEVPLF